MKQRFRGLASRILYLALGCVSSFVKKFRKSENFGIVLRYQESNLVKREYQGLASRCLVLKMQRAVENCKESGFLR